MASSLLHTKPLPKRGLLLKEEFASLMWEQILSLKFITSGLRPWLVISSVMLSTLGKNFCRRHFETFFLFFYRK